MYLKLFPEGTNGLKKLAEYFMQKLPLTVRKQLTMEILAV